MNDKNYDVVIVGGGISGAALFYELAKYTDVKRICMLEKYEALATLNTKGTSNSQTIHVGDIETNYTLEKAKITKRTAKMVEKFCLQYGLENKVMFAHQKMALGVGDKEVEFITKRYHEFKELFPYLELWDKEKLKELEPKLVEMPDGTDRPENIVAMGARDQYTTVDFGKMTEELVKQAQSCEGVVTDVYFNSEVEDIKKTSEGYELKTDGVHRIGPPANILQIHPRTASAPGTLAGLAARYRAIGHKLRAGQPLTPAEENYIGYDAVQLMPIEPTIVYEAGPPFWEMQGGDPTAGEVRVVLRKPDTSNWGYDIVISASPAVNPAVLGSRRPDELVDLIAALHNFPGKPVKMIFDIVYGHADNQALPLLNRHYFAGSGMYGQEMNFRHPVVRAILLEMQRRKSNYGVDGLRVDGAQDFKYWDSESGVLRHDDDFLTLMNNVEQEVAGRRYRPWMIFEDGRPWPRDDWELASTYREVTKQHPNVWQWGPLTAWSRPNRR